MLLNQLKPSPGSKKTRKRVGRGVGSGLVKTSGRGSKGHNSRSGGGVRPGFEGGQMPIHRRLPKRGFTNIFKKEFIIINIRDLAKFESGSTVDTESLVKLNIIKLSSKKQTIKLLGQGEISYPLTVNLEKISESAKEKIKAVGGSVIENIEKSKNNEA